MVNKSILLVKKSFESLCMALIHCESRGLKMSFNAINLNIFQGFLNVEKNSSFLQIVGITRIMVKQVLGPFQALNSSIERE